MKLRKHQIILIAVMFFGSLSLCYLFPLWGYGPLALGLLIYLLIQDNTKP